MARKRRVASFYCPGCKTTVQASEELELWCTGRLTHPPMRRIRVSVGQQKQEPPNAEPPR